MQIARLHNPPVGGPVKENRRRRFWLVLCLGFGGLLACLLGATLSTLISFQRLRESESRERKIFLERLRSLDRIRSQIYLSGTYARDFLLSPDTDTARTEAAHLAVLKVQSRESVEAYGRGLGASELRPFESFRNEIVAYWKVLDATIAWSPQERDRLRYSFFYNELVPRRTSMLQIADRITSANEQGLIASDARASASADDLQHNLILTFTLTMAGGLALAILTIATTLRLERELDQRRADLQELSTLLLRAQENERRSLARELHDGIGQSLSAILMEAEAADCGDSNGERAQHIGSVKTLAERTINQVRDLSLLLRPSMLDDLGLAPALNWHARETAKRTGRNVTVTTDDSIDALPEDHRTCIYRVVQEAVNNAVRHANARTIQVAVYSQSAKVDVSVQDDGSGFDTRVVRGLGLLGMEERVRRLGGMLKISSEPGQGTLVEAALPLASLPQRNGNGAHKDPAG